MTARRESEGRDVCEDTGCARRFDGDSAQGTMLEVIDNGYRRLSEADLRAIDTFLRSLAPVRSSRVSSRESRP